MTTIFKMANQENITSTFEKVERDMIAPQNDEGRAIPSSLDEDGISLEMDRLEKCASAGQNYSYNSEWPVEQVSRLREYAEVVGFKGKMMPVTASNETQTVVEDDDVMKQLSSVKASEVNASSGLRLAVGDPFLLSDKNDVVKTKDNWEKVNPENKLASSPNQNARSGGIIPIRGEFEFKKQQQLRVRPGENSLASPDAIGLFAQEQDTGERLKSENINHKNERKAAKSAWQKEAVETAKNLGAGALPRGHVFMTASIPEKKDQSGLDLASAVNELSGMNAPTIPELNDLTDGEKIHQANTKRKAEIQRKASDDNWQKVKGTKRPSLDDAFADALEFQMAKSGIKTTQKQ